MKQILFALLLLFPLCIQAQILSVTPIFPQQTDTVTIVYDASQGNAALIGLTPVFAHTGVISNFSANPTDWQHVQGNWGTNDPNVSMIDLGNNLHQIKYHIETFYGVQAGEQVTALSFVFRNIDGSIVGREGDGSDIFYPVYGPGQLNATFIAPATDFVLASIGNNITVEGAASSSATLSLTDNGTQVFTTTGTTLNYSLPVTIGGNHEVILIADNGTTVARDTFNYTVNPAVNFSAVPAGTELGITYPNTSTARFYLYSPGKTFAYILGDFNNYVVDTAYFMNRTPDNSAFWIDVPGLTPGQEYTFQYYIDGELKVADPFSTVVLDPNNDQYIPTVTYPNLPAYPTGKTTSIVTVIQPGATPYTWQNSSFTPPAKEDLVVYELLVRDFVARHDYQTLIDSLDYLENLGINAIEIMPVNEFEGNESWGYNPSFHMALDKYYGTKDDFKAFVDECHGRGIAVIMDVVYNHAFSQSPLCQMWWDAVNFKPAPDNPYLNPDARHPFNVGYDFNHEAFGTQEWFKRVNSYWIDEFQVDGFRFDLSKGFTQNNTGSNVGAWSQYDQSRIDLWKNYANFLWSVDPDSYLILEHFSDNDEETELANHGFMIWGNHVNEYNEATMGYIANSNFEWIDYQRRNWQNPGVLGYLESHDEERLMFKNISFGNVSGAYDTRDTATALDRMELAGAFFFTIPGPKLFWQFGEVGYDVSIDDPCRVCPKPIKWNYYQDPDRRDLYNVWSALIKLKTTYPTFKTTNYTLNLAGDIKTLYLYDNAMNVVIAGNFDVIPKIPNIGFPNDGWWYEYFSGDSIEVTNNNRVIALDEGAYKLYTDVKLPAPVFTVPIGLEADLKPLDLPLLIWPNPTEGMAELAYTLDQAGEVSIEVFDLSGRQVANLQEGTKVPGAYGIQLDGSQWGAGRYVVKIRAGNRQGWKFMDVQ